ncbi:G-protein-signaling modulator 2-like [Anneissia japonica]|uniref:G-protein-signaling modulator 2-like n=1 Tax=Anneissia japonica TaxID=1529436 RepID=UPI00142565B9|nr:G-protein-signaling modulator 2-like [Anneissia japonica]XP_033119141.1 G-protein-signaling modulator 2-like [Anneissia japonica]XP_033119142.1 G-protein-signaling modulator 2-like [Anneissia japonica]
MRANMDMPCMELALEGERLCKMGCCREGVEYFEAAVKVGTDDLKTLSAIYSQLGNAYFYLQEYGKALEYHRHDLTLASTIGDRLGEAKARGNLGNTLKVLGKFDEAVMCCQGHLDISRELGDKMGEARALYNLGNVFHAKGKHSNGSGHQDPGDFPRDVKQSLLTAIDYYEANLKLVRELGDRAAQGRACGNLGNTYYLLGDFDVAIKYHEERLFIAKEFGDKAAERRAYSNLGNAHVFKGEFETAADYYKRTLLIARGLADQAIEAQACYSLGNTFTLLRDFEQAVEYHMRHLHIAQHVNDRVGEGRAYWSLGNAYTALKKYEKAIQYASFHLEISKEVGDKTGEIIAQMNLSDLTRLVGNGFRNEERNGSSICSREDDGKPRRRSMENLELVRMTPEKNSSEKPNKDQVDGKPKGARVKEKSSKEKLVHAGSNNSIGANKATDPGQVTVNLKPPRKYSSPDFDDSFFDLLSRFQGNRMDEQRMSLPKSNSLDKCDTSDEGKEELMNSIAKFQGKRMNEQRMHVASLPGLRGKDEELLSKLKEASSVPDDDFFDMLIRCQGTRIEDQRTDAPERVRAPTVPDEDFFSLISRVQSQRLEEQRCDLPESLSRDMITDEK